MENQNKYKFKVVFANYYKVENPSYEDGDIVITPANDSWNDFGKQIHCQFNVYSKDFDCSIDGTIYIGILPLENKPDSPIFKSLKEALESDVFVNGFDQLRYFSMLPDMESYRYLITKLGVEKSMEFLSTLNDMVYFKKKSEKWIKQAKKSKAFNLGFLRNSESYFAFNNAERLFSGVDLEPFSLISNKLRLLFKLDSFENYHSINFSFGDAEKSIIPKRISVLIGENGIGKSQSLNIFCKCLLNRERVGDWLHDVSKKPSRPMVNRVLAINGPGETSSTFPGEYVRSQKIYYRRINLSRNVRSDVTSSIGKSLIDLARLDNGIKGISRWQLFINAINKVIPVDKLFIKFKINSSLNRKYVSIPDIQGINSEQVRLEIWSSINPKSNIYINSNGRYHPLSSGQLAFIKLALFLCLHIDNGTFVLLDEPETHLHPSFIADLTKLLDFILEKTGSYAIIATHSVYFVREVARSQVHIFKRINDGFVDVQNPRLRTFGSDVDSISQFVFDEDPESILIDKILKNIKGRSFESIDEELSKELSLGALMTIKQHLEPFES